jgi:hypothetical protein
MGRKVTARYKGRSSRKTVKFPHVVEIPVPPSGLGKRLDAMHAFHSKRGITACLGRGRRENSRNYLRWYFAAPKTAADFASKFGGKRRFRTGEP